MFPQRQKGEKERAEEVPREEEVRRVRSSSGQV